MSKNVYQFIDVKRIDPAKKSISERKINFVEIYQPLKTRVELLEVVLKKSLMMHVEHIGHHRVDQLFDELNDHD